AHPDRTASLHVDVRLPGRRAGARRVAVKKAGRIQWVRGKAAAYWGSPAPSGGAKLPPMTLQGIYFAPIGEAVERLNAALAFPWITDGRDAPTLDAATLQVRKGL